MRRRADGLWKLGWTGPATAAAVVALAYLAGAALSATGWVSDPGLGFVGAAAAALVTLLAYLKVSGRAPLVGVVVALILAVSLFAGRDFAIRSGDPHSAALAGVWARRLVLDATLGSGVLHSFFFYSVVWVSGGWLAWSTVRLKNPLFGLLPVTAVFAIGLLNSTGDDSLVATLFLALLLALLLLTSFRRLRRHTHETGQALTASVSRRYWVVGSAMVAAAVLGSAVLPPLSTTDMSDVVQGQLTAIRTWLGEPAAGAGLAGFSLEAPLSGPLVGNSQVVFTYVLPNGSAAEAPVYFRGADLTLTSAGEWRFAVASQQATVPADSPIQYAETYQDTTSLSVRIRPVNPPPTAPSTFFYPGQLLTASAPLTVSQSALARRGQFTQTLRTLDLAEITGTSAQVYSTQSLVSTATPDQLRAAGNAYPSWVIPYTTLSAGFRNPSGIGGAFATVRAYRPAATLDRTRQLALQVTANADNPYDKAMAVESYLRSNYRYSLTPPATPAGKDPIDQFLFSSKAGYCQFFATAMGDMLRSLGIPTRLVNGFGPGSPTAITGQYVVTESDAHTWVEAYFPAYGWISFEPTPQPGYSSIGRGLASVPSSSTAPTPALVAPPTTVPAAAAAAASGLKAFTTAASSGVRPWLALTIALLLLVGLVMGLIFWRPSSIRGVWRRVRAASYLAGVAHQPWETPNEFGTRLTRRFPEVAPAIETLTGHYSRAAYGNRPKESLRPSALDALSKLEGHLVRTAFRRVRSAALRRPRLRGKSL